MFTCMRRMQARQFDGANLQDETRGVTVMSLIADYTQTSHTKERSTAHDKWKSKDRTLRRSGY